MSIVEMQKVHIVSLGKYKDGILKILQENEVIDIQNMPKEEQITKDDESEKHELRLAEIKSAIAFLERIANKKKSFIETFIPPKEELTEEELQTNCQEFNCSEILERHKDLETRLANLKNLKNNLQTKLEALLPWQNFNLPLNTQSKAKITRIALGSLKTKLFKDFKKKMEEISYATDINVVNQTKVDTYISILYLVSESKIISSILSNPEFNLASLPETDKTPAQEILHIRNLQKEIELENRQIIADAKNLTQHLIKLEYMYDFVLQKKSRLELKHKFANTDYTFIIEGWIRKSDYDKLIFELSKVTNELEIFRIKPAKGEKTPVVLKNANVFSPFELITKIYGTPKYNEFDPSVPLSFFFALFFGLCLGDFGYGLILAVISFYFLKKYRLPEGGKNLFRLLMFGGGVAIVVGILTGSYLGLTPKEIPTTLLPLRELLTSIQIVDPIRNPLTMLVFSLALGVTQILFGITLQMALLIRKKEYVSAILDDGLWLFFLSALVFLIVASALSLPTATMASKMSIAGAIALVLTQGRHKKKIVHKLLSGLLSLYKLTGYMGDTLSYSRLLALGMSSAIIGSVINILAGMVKGGVPVLGIILMVILLIVGHLFNLVVSTLGAFVHSTRLQMVEFFSKFYEGGGREFRPYKRVAEYTILK